MHIIIEILFKILGYSLFIYGLWRLVGESILTYVKIGFRNYKTRRKLKRLHEINLQKERKIKKSKFMERVEIVLSTISNNENVNAQNFVMLTVILFLVSTVTLYFLIYDIFFSVLIGFVLGLSPYLINFYRLEVLRLKTSLGFLDEFHVFVQNYQESQNNVYYTLLNSMNDIRDKHLKRQLGKLISAFQKERSEEEFRKHVHVFVFAINSTFAKRFGALLIKAHLDNVNIGRSIIDLNNDIAERKKGMEEEKTNRLQSVMLGFSPIFVLPIVVFMAIQVTGVLNFWTYFLKPPVLVLFILSVILSVISVLLALLLRNPKADI